MDEVEGNENENFAGDRFRTAVDSVDSTCKMNRFGKQVVSRRTGESIIEQTVDVPFMRRETLTCSKLVSIEIFLEMD